MARCNHDAMKHPGIPFETFLQVRAATGGAFSPDGRTLALLTNTTGVPQVYRQDAAGADPAPLTSFNEIARAVHWSPDGTRLLFTMDAGGSECEQLYLLAPDGSECRALTADPRAIHTFGGWAPDSRRIAFAANRRNSAFFDLYVLDVDTGAEQCVLECDAFLNAVGWTPDGAGLLVRRHHAAFNQDLSLLDLATGAERPLTPHSGEARYGSTAYLPDGRRVLLCTDQDRDFLALCLLDTHTGVLEPLLAEDADVESCDLSADGTRFAALVNRDGWSELALGELAPTSTAYRRVALNGVATSVRHSGNGAVVAVSGSGPTRNPNIWSVEFASGEVTPWTRAPMGALPREVLVEPELVHYPSPGDPALEIPAWLYRPPHAPDAPLPVIVHVHGGPESQDRPGFSAVYQYLALRGYAVLAPNVRGSTGYGNTYCHLDDKEKRYDALQDVANAYHWLVASGIGDPARIGIMGGSYGGFTVLYCLTRQPELWAVGVDIVGIANFETFFQHTGPYRRHLRASEYGDPVQDAALLRDLSPIHRVDAIRAPLMVIQGANDPRVPQVESDQMVEQLRARSHPVEYLLFPDEGHGIVKIPNRITAYTAIGEFLERYLPTA